MKITCISDTHQQYWETLEPTDLLIHAGDMCGRGTLDEVIAFAAWFAGQRAQHKIVIAGNHDWVFAGPNNLAARRVLQDYGIIYLQDEAVEIEGAKIYGSPYTPKFYNWAFMLERSSPEMAAKWQEIPNDTNILITHGPIYGILDKALSAPHAGCEVLRRRIEELDKLALHVFGHLHGGYGRETAYILLNNGSRAIDYVNAAICNDFYEPMNPPIVVEL